MGKAMKKKLILGTLFLCSGIALIIFSIHAMIEVSKAKGFVDNLTDFFSNNPTWNPLITFFGGQAQQKASAYDFQAIVCLVIGVVLSVAGSLIIFSPTRKE